YGIQRLFYDWLPEEPGAVNDQLAIMAAHHPKDGWVRREMASQASVQGRHDDALAEADLACLYSPERPEAHGTRGWVLLRRDGYAAASPSLRRALALDADYDFAMRTLITAAPDATQARAAVDLAAAELLRQTVQGDALLCFQTTAWRGWAPTAVARLLWRALRQQPDVWEAWVAMGRQWTQMGRSSRAHRLLSAAAARFTGLPRVQVELAEALRQIGDRDQAMAACGRALAVSPGWNRAVRLQVDLMHEAGAPWEQAEQLIQRALHHAHDDDDLMGLLAWVHERQKRDDDAIAQARRSLLLNPRPEWIWHLVRRICERTERLRDFDALLSEVERSRPGDAWAWTVRAQHGRDDSEALEAAVHAISLKPTLEEAWEARFERLARLSRHDDIDELLGALPWPGHAPVSLTAWGARVAWRRGEHAAACERLRHLMSDQSGNESLWRELADWEDERDENAGYLDAAQHMRALAPHRAINHAYVGHALYKLKRHQEALGPLRRGVELDPTYAFAARVLCLSATETADYDLAEWAMSAAWRHAPTAAHATMALRAACRAKDRLRALEWLDRLAGLDEYEFSESGRACAFMEEAGWGDALRHRQLIQMERGVGPPGLAYHWVEKSADRIGRLRTLYRARGLLRTARGPLLARGLVRWLTNTRQNLALLYVIARNDAALRADLQTWGDVSYALLNLDEHKAVIRWMKDWRDRPQAPIFALSNLCASLATRGRWDDMREVVEHGLPRAPYQEDMRMWQLALLADHGEWVELDRQLARRHEWKPDEWMKPALRLLEAYADLVRQGGDGASVAAFRQAGLVDGLTRVIWARLKGPARWRHTRRSRWWLWLLPP
ncbi:MAG: hypothetical protein ABW220_14015, partial [Burkholderiaceae bacterium]